MSKKSRTGSENGFRVIADAGISLEPEKERAKVRSKMFQYMKMKKKGNYRRRRRISFSGTGLLRSRTGLKFFRRKVSAGRKLLR